MHGMIWRYNGVHGKFSIARSWVLSLLHVNRSLSQRQMYMRNVFIPFIILLPTRLRQRAYRTSHVQNPYTFHSGRSSSQGYSFKSPLLHHIVRMHIHTHPPVSSCNQRPFSISLSTSKHHHTLFTRSTLRDLPSQLGQHAYDREQH